MNKKSGIESLLCVGPLLVQKIIHFLSFSSFIFIFIKIFFVVSRKEE